MVTSRRFAWRIARVRGVDLRVHWSMPCTVFALAISPWIWAGVMLTIVVHEAGHAVMVKLCKLRLVAIELNVVGGRVDYMGALTERNEAAVAWGGILGQAVLCAVCVAVWLLADPVKHEFQRDCAEILLLVNAVLVVLNAIPFGPLDGAKMWRIIPAPRRRKPKPKRPPPDERHRWN